MLSSLYHDNLPVTIGILAVDICQNERTSSIPTGLYALPPLSRRKILLLADDQTRLHRKAGLIPEIDRASPKVSDIITLKMSLFAGDFERIAERRLVLPSPDTLRLVQDKFIQNKRWSVPNTCSRLCCHQQRGRSVRFCNQHGYPYVMKTRTLAGDGYGNATVGRDNRQWSL